jgi:hypothetical protein
MAVLSAMAHGRDPVGCDDHPVFAALIAALRTFDEDHAKMYADAVLAVLPKAARDCLEVLMTINGYRYESDFARLYVAEGEAKGKAEGKAEAVLAVLDARGIEVTGLERAGIQDCGDPEQLELWIRRAVTAEKVSDLFA